MRISRRIFDALPAHARYSKQLDGILAYYTPRRVTVEHAHAFDVSAIGARTITVFDVNNAPLVIEYTPPQSMQRDHAPIVIKPYYRAAYIDRTGTPCRSVAYTIDGLLSQLKKLAPLSIYLDVKDKIFRHDFSAKLLTRNCAVGISDS